MTSKFSGDSGINGKNAALPIPSYGKKLCHMRSVVASAGLSLSMVS